MESIDEYPWSLAYKYPINGRKLVDYVLLAEFDIDTGSTLRHKYPNEIIGYKDDYFAENMLPDGAHNRDKDYNYIFLNRDKILLENDTTINDSSNNDYFLYGINIVKTKFDTSVRRGAIVKAISIFSPYHFIDSFIDVLEEALDNYFIDSTVDILENLFISLNNLTNGIQLPNDLERCLMRRGVVYDQFSKPLSAYIPESWYQSTSLSYNNKSFDIIIPLYRSLNEFGNVSIIKLIKVFGESVMRIYHGIITNQRILFVGYNHATSDIAQIVLSSVALVSPPINTIKRVYPYANFSDLSFLEVPGYIAGATNPMFQQKDTWWDLLCILDLPNNTAIVYNKEEFRNEDKRNQSTNNTKSSNNINVYDDYSHVRSDSKFISNVISGISINNLNEYWVKQLFYDYTTTLCRILVDNNNHINTENYNEESKRLITNNIARCMILNSSNSFVSIPTNYPFHNSSNGELLYKYIRRLQVDFIEEIELENIYSVLNSLLATELDLQGLLVFLPESLGGLIGISVGLLHGSPIIRYHTIQILLKCNDYQSTKYSLDNFNIYIQLSYDRQLKLYENGTLLDEIKRYQEKVNESSNDLLSYDEDTILNSYIQPTLNILFDDDANDTIDNSLDISTDSITPINPIDFIP